MKNIILVGTLILLSACSSTENTSQQRTFTLYTSTNTPVSTHQNYNDCLAASVRENIKKTNEWNSSNKPHQRVSIQNGNKPKVACK